MSSKVVPSHVGAMRGEAGGEERRPKAESGALKGVLDGLLQAGTISEERHSQALAALEAQHPANDASFEFGAQSPAARRLRGMWFRHWPRSVLKAMAASGRAHQRADGADDDDGGEAEDDAD